jgi:signal transduction histidine kinase
VSALGDLDAEASDFARLIRKGGVRLMNTLESVLSLSQLESGTMQLRLARLDVREVMHDVTEAFTAQAETRGVVLSLEAPDTPVLITCDRGALARIATNLVHNAVKFTEAGGRVEARLAAGPEAVTLEVADTGIGINKAFLPKLFQAFEQESTGNAREYEGVGLGLTITSRLVALVGGSIDVASTKGEGTTFTVRLPREASA